MSVSVSGSVGLLLVMSLAASGEVRVFQEGAGSWSGTFDRVVAGDGTVVDGSGVESYFLDGDPVTSVVAEDRNLLLRFDGVFGAGTDQVPSGATILSASLVLRTEVNPSTGPYVIGRLDQAVDGTTVYGDLTDGLFSGVRGAVARPVSAGFVDLKAGEILTADLTGIVREWQSGAPNHGVAVYSSFTTDSWEVASSGNALVERRPKLVIEFTTEATTERAFTATRAALLDSSAGDPTIDAGLIPYAPLDEDPDDVREALLGFDDLFGEGLGQIPAGEVVVRAELVMTTLLVEELEIPSADSLDVFGVFPMLVDWDLSGDPDPVLDFGAAGPTIDAGEIDCAVAEFSGMGQDSQARADVTELVKAWRSGQPNHGVNVKLVSGNSDSWYVSMPGTAGAHEPRLVVTTAASELDAEEGVMAFRQGQDGYQGAFQMRIDLGDGKRLPEAFPTYLLDGDPPTEDANDLLRFDGVAAALPAGATVLSAQLEYSTGGASSGSASEGPYVVGVLDTAVDETTLYSALSGIGAGSGGVRGTLSARLGGFSQMVPGQRVRAEVGETVQGWVDGETNFGFGVFAADSTDGWEVATICDVVARRPSLRVEYVTTPTERFTLGALRVAVIRQGDSTVDGFSTGFAKIEADVGSESQLLLGFDDLLGEGVDQVGAETEVLRAWLILNTGDLSGDSSVGPAVVRAMEVDWDLATQYSDFGADGPSVGDGEVGGIAATLFGMGVDAECRLDVTEVVKAWQAGADNQGLVVQAGTDDSWWMRMVGISPELGPRLQVVVGVESGFDDYVAGLGFPGMTRDDDGDGDGIPALVEYGLGLNPGVLDALGGLVASLGGFSLDYLKGAEAKLDGVIQYEIQRSSNLEDWSKFEGAVETADGIGVTVPASGSGFYRLKVTEG